MMYAIILAGILYILIFWGIEKEIKHEHHKKNEKENEQIGHGVIVTEFHKSKETKHKPIMKRKPKTLVTKFTTQFTDEVAEAFKDIKCPHLYSIKANKENLLIGKTSSFDTAVQIKDLYTNYYGESAYIIFGPHHGEFERWDKSDIECRLLPYTNSSHKEKK